MNHFARIRFIVAFCLFFEFILNGFLYFCQTFNTVTYLFETVIGTVLWFENVYLGGFEYIVDGLKPLQNSPKSYKFSPNKNEEDFSHV